MLIIIFSKICFRYPRDLGFFIMIHFPQQAERVEGIVRRVIMEAEGPASSTDSEAYSDVEVIASP